MASNQLKIGFYASGVLYSKASGVFLKDTSLETLVKWTNENGFQTLEVYAVPEDTSPINPKNLLSENPPSDTMSDFIESIMTALPGGSLINIKTVVESQSKADEIKDLLARNNVTISSLTYIRGNLYNTKKQKDIVEYFKLMIQACAKLGISVFGTQAGFPAQGKSKMQTIEEDFPKIFSPLADFAAEYGVKIALENWYPTLLQAPVHWEKAFEVVPAKNLGLIFDPSHLVWQQIDYLWALDMFKDRIFHFHVKDVQIDEIALRKMGNQFHKVEYEFLGGGWWRYCIPNFGKADWPAIITSLRKMGYDGGLCIECEEWGDKKDALIKARNFISQFV